MIKCELEFNIEGTVANLYHWHGPYRLCIARFGVRGPFKRNAVASLTGHESTFQAELRGIADWLYIDDDGITREVRGV